MFGRKSRKAKAERAARAAEATHWYRVARKSVMKANLVATRAENAQDERELEMLHGIWMQSVETAREYLAVADRIEAELIWELPTVPEPSRKGA